LVTAHIKIGENLHCLETWKGMVSFLEKKGHEESESCRRIVYSGGSGGHYLVGSIVARDDLSHGGHSVATGHTDQYYLLLKHEVEEMS
jgi:hypothetical protein